VFETRPMVDALLLLALLVGIATLFVAVYILRTSRRSEALGKDRHELLRDQHYRLEMLREERRMLTEQLERESRERRLLTEYLEQTDPRLMENLERWRQACLESEREVERLEEERERLQQEQSSDVEQERQRLAENLESGRKKRVEVHRQAERQVGERVRLERKLSSRRQTILAKTLRNIEPR
jgi:hypothetical protein